MRLPGLSETAIREAATPESFRRGWDYYDRGAVLSLTQRGNVVEAEVEGSQPEPYNVRVEYDEGGITEAACDCPYDWGGWCKHIVATLLACLHDPESVAERPPLAQLLEGLDRDQLQRLLLDLVANEPRLAPAVESRIALLSAASSSAASAAEAPSRTRVTPVDALSFRRQVRQAMHSLDRMRSSEAYWHVEEVVAEVRSLLDQAWAFTRAGDGGSGLVMLEALTEEYLAGYEYLDDSDGFAGDFFAELGPAWAEALLSADLTAEERQDWVKKIESWQLEWEDYGLDDVFDPALGAAVQGWECAGLRQVLAGEAMDEDEPEALLALWDGGLIGARLNVLERQGRLEEYLRLARAAAQHERYATMLVRLGRIAEATAHGLEHLALAAEALTLAKALRELGGLEAALQVGQRGLSLAGPKTALSSWLGALAAGMGKTELALAAALAVFEETPSLGPYLRVQELAGEGWASLRSELLERLRQRRSYFTEGPVDVFLHEGLVDDAMAVVERGTDFGVLARVVEAAKETYPDWTIKTCRGQAEPIMNEGRAKYYDAAARWLAKARDAYLASGREQEWRAYLADLLMRHGRKYKLVPMLMALE
ncbi:MAG: SWIM zinc finger family protein [Chloroflexota bacterium]